MFLEQRLDGPQHPWREFAGQDLAGEDIDRRVLTTATNVDVGTATPFSGVEVEADRENGRSLMRELDWRAIRGSVQEALAGFLLNCAGRP